ncbi:MAG: hypothetical protein U5R06_08210 [candidate division KSB1 bacterium]|nr:hypothetical protein [candidate division KSB1 bacterium]
MRIQFIMNIPKKLIKIKVIKISGGGIARDITFRDVTAAGI